MPPRPAMPASHVSSTATTNQIVAPPRSSIALEVERGPAGEPVQPPERVVMVGDRVVRYVQVHERIDLSFLDKSGGQVRVRVTMLPGAAANPTLNVKGLTCFVAKKGGRPTPATSVSQDGALELVSTSRETLGEISWSFGRADAQGRAFLVDGRQLLVPYSEAQQAVAVMLSSGHDIVIMCRS